MNALNRIEKTSIEANFEEQAASSSETLLFTQHAKARMQQRGIKPQWVDLVLEYGREVYQQGRHSYSVSLEKLGIQKLKTTYGAIKDLNKLRQMYVVLADDGAIVTCAYR